MRETDGWTLLAIVGLTVISVVTRSFFFISEREWRLPEWAQRGLQYAPIAALSAVIAPDILRAPGARWRRRPTTSPAVAAASCCRPASASAWRCICPCDCYLICSFLGLPGAGQWPEMPKIRTLGTVK